MTDGDGRGEIPSYKNVVAGETSRNGVYRGAGRSNKDIPVMGAHWQTGLGSRCFPKATKKPRYVIPKNKVEEYREYMKDHALIYKFVGT